MRHLLTLVSLLFVGSLWADDFNFNSPKAKAAMEKYQYDKEGLLRNLETASEYGPPRLLLVASLNKSEKKSKTQKNPKAEKSASAREAQNQESKSSPEDADASESPENKLPASQNNASKSDNDWFEKHFFKQGKFWRTNLSKELDKKLTKAKAARNKLLNNRREYSKLQNKKQQVKGLEKAVKKNVSGKKAKKKVGKKFKKPKRQLEKGKKQEVSAGKEQRNKLKKQLESLKKMADKIEKLRADARTSRVIESYDYQLSKEDWNKEIEVIKHVLKNKVSK